MKKSIIAMMTILVLAGVSSSCGSPNEDVAKALTALTPLSSSLVLRGAIREAHARAHERADEVKARVELAARLRDMSVISSLKRELIFSGASCVESASTADSRLNFSCKWALSGESASCGDATYTYGNGIGALDFEMSTSGSKTTLGTDVGVNTDIRGGEVTGAHKVECHLSLKMTVDSDTGNLSFGIGSCGGFSCTIDGSAIDCKDLREAIRDASCLEA